MSHIPVVGVMFFENGKLLIVKPSKKPTYQMVGGKIEEGETPFEATLRESQEELGNKVILNSEKIEFVMKVIEKASSDPSKTIEMHIYRYTDILRGEFTNSEEIANFHWYGINDDVKLSYTLKNVVIPYAIENGFLYETKVNK